MKKVTFLIFFLSAFSLYACSGPDDDKKDKTKQDLVQLDSETFQKLVWNYKKNPKEWVFEGKLPVIIDFYADWCRPCKMIGPILEELGKEYKGKIIVYKVNVDQQKELAGMFNVRSIPAVMFVPRTGKPQMSVGAMQKADYVKAINEVLKVK